MLIKLNAKGIVVTMKDKVYNLHFHNNKEN